MQSKQDLEDFYSTPDPWGYKTNDDDENRRKYVSAIAKVFAPFPGLYDRALDIGAGEGFMTSAIPCTDIEYIEISDKAASRVHPIYKRVKKPAGKYDFILCTGQLYEQYDYQLFLDWIYKHSSGIVLVSHYNKAGRPHDDLHYNQIFYAEFPYREGKQILRVYDSLS